MATDIISNDIFLNQNMKSSLGNQMLDSGKETLVDLHSNINLYIYTSPNSFLS